MADHLTASGWAARLADFAKRGGETLSRRFPLAAALVCATALVAALRVFEVSILDGDRHDSHLLSLTAIGALAALAAALLAEGCGWSRRTGLWIGAGLAALVAARHVATDPNDPATLLFLAPGTLLLCSAAAYVRISDSAYWSAHFAAAQGVVLSYICGIVLAGGLSVLGLAMEVLFRLDVPQQYYGLAGVLGMALLAPLAMLAMIPNPGLVAEPARWARLASLGLLLPLAAVYLLVVYGYIATILVSWELPRGVVAPVVGGFAAFAIGVYADIYPWRKHWNWVPRAVFALLAAPTALLAVAVYRRIAEYGVTEERALLVVIATWLSAMIVAHVAARPRLPVLAASLGALLVLGSFGPWGANAVSTRSQMAKLTAMLEDSGRIADGRLVKSEETMPQSDANETHSLLSYLNASGKWKAVARLAPDTSNNFDERIDSFLEAGNIPKPQSWTDESGIQGFQFADAGALATEGFSLAAALPLWPHDEHTIAGIEGDTYEMRIERSDGLVRITAADGRLVEFDLREVVSIALSSELPGGHPVAVATDLTETFRVKLLLQGAFGRLERYGPELHDGLFMILIDDSLSGGDRVQSVPSGSNHGVNE